MADVRTADRSVARFLEQVHDHVLELGVREHLEVHAVLGGDPQRSHQELRASLSAMLARDQGELERIGALFDAHYPLSAGGPGDPPDEVRLAPPVLQTVSVPRSGPRRPNLLDPISWSARRVLAAVVFALAITSVLFVALLIVTGSAASLPGEEPDAHEDAPQSPVDSSSIDGVAVDGVSDDGGSDGGGWRAVEIVYSQPEIGRPIDRRDWGAFVGAWVVLYLGLRWWLLPRASTERQKASVDARRERAHESRRAMAQRLAESGEPLHLAYSVPKYPALRPTALNDAANLLGRLFRRERGDHLDMGRTIRETIREGGRFVPVLEPGRGARDIVVLVDVERGDHPWLGGVQRALDYLERANVALIRFTFAYGPLWLDPARGGPPVHSRELSRHFPGAALVIVSRDLSPRVNQEDAEWLGYLGAFPVKAWIDPDPRPLLRRGAVARDVEALEWRGLKRFPWTEEGVRAVAVYLAREGESTQGAPWPELPSHHDARVAEAVEAWALCAALVPDATWDQLEAIRRHPDFPEIGGVLAEPAALQCLLDWVAQEVRGDAEIGHGRTLDLPSELVDRLVRKHRQRCRGAPHTQSLEARAHGLLLKQLDGERPKDPLQLLRRELKVASHWIVLAPERTLALMLPFLGTAVEEEAIAVLAAELARQSDGCSLGGRCVLEADREKLGALTGESAFVPLRELFWGHWGVTWNALGGATVIVAALALGVINALKFDGPKRFLLGQGERRIGAELPVTYETTTPSDKPQRAPQ